MIVERQRKAQNPCPNAKRNQSRAADAMIPYCKYMSCERTGWREGGVDGGKGWSEILEGRAGLGAILDGWNAFAVASDIEVRAGPAFPVFGSSCC
jgi:hypothetical protein